jgi:acetyl-CoA C-acetyltransferase
MTASVVVAGLGQTMVGERWDTSLRHLALEAITTAIEDAGGIRPQALFVANTLAPSLSGQSHLGALIADFAGLGGIEATTVESSGASGGVALRQAYLFLASQSAEAAMVVGVEKITDQTPGEIEAALATGTDSDYEAVQGITPSAQAAMLARRYFHENKVPAGALAGFSITAHENAVVNPYAMYRNAISLEQYQRAPALSDPLNVYDAAPLADGAAAVMLTREDRLPPNPNHPMVRIAGSSVATAPVALHDLPDPLVLEAAKKSVRKAYAMAAVDAKDIDLFELHDRFSILAALALEAAGFASKGKGWELALDGAIGRSGHIPISTFGGSKARGDPGAATGVYQACEVVMQLQNRAGESQIDGATRGMAQCLGGSGATAATHIFEKVA